MKKIVMLLIALLLPLTAAAQTQNPAIAKAETWLNQLQAAKARFTLTAPDGTQQTGNFYISRPGRLRFEYDAPSRDFIVADGVMIHYYDGDQHQASNAPIGSTLADFLLRPKIRLSGDLRVTDVRSSGGLLQIEVVQAADAGAGSLTLGFNEDPFYLKKWRVVDAQGGITETDLGNFKAEASLAPSLFVFRDPSGRGRLNK